MRTRHLPPLLLVVLVFLGLSASASEPQSVPAADEALKAVKAKFAPDTRLAVFDLTTERRGTAVVLKGEVGQQAAKDAAIAAVKAAGHAEIVDEILVLPDPALGARLWGIVTVSVAHVRGRPSHPAEQVTELPMGAIVHLLKLQNGWYYAQTETEHYLGYFEPSHLAVVDRSGLDAWHRAPKLMTTALFTLVREQPALDADPVCDLVMGSVVKAAGRADGWFGVELPDGRKGYVEQASVQDYDAWKASRRPTPENIERTARQFMGMPYIWGGTSPKGCDCSGFTQMVFRFNGIELPRDADQQGEVGQPIAIDEALSQARTGDLLMFSPSPTRRDRITHVGIYLGNRAFIHCAGMVKRNSFDPASPIYSENLLKRLVSIRRVLPSTATAR